MIINDYQRGRLPHYVAPPELKDESGNHSNAGGMVESENANNALAVIEGIELKQQNLDAIERSAHVEEAKGSSIVVDESECGNDGKSIQEDDGCSDDDEDAPVSLAVKGGEEWD